MAWTGWNLDSFPSTRLQWTTILHHTPLIFTAPHRAAPHLLEPKVLTKGMRGIGIWVCNEVSLHLLRPPSRPDQRRICLLSLLLCRASRLLCAKIPPCITM